MIEFQCNVCGIANRCPESEFSRESACCSLCGSTVRMRGAIAALSVALYGRAYEIARFPRHPRFRGLGISDWDGYVERLPLVLDYHCTYYDQPPRLDITAVPEAERGRYDFVTAIDVFEHVPPPVSRGFAGAASLLKPGGVLVLSVPYSLDDRTIEHFPNLHDFEIVDHGGAPRLVNTTVDGRVEVFDDRVFHGGGGKKPEM